MLTLNSAWTSLVGFTELRMVRINLFDVASRLELEHILSRSTKLAPTLKI